MDMLGLVVRLICSLALVLGLLLLIARFAGKRFQGRTGAPVQVVHRQPISRGSSVSVVTVGTRILVLGSTDQQVTLLAELEPDELDLPEAPDLSNGDTPRQRPEGQAPATGALGGSILSPQTWKQALAAAKRDLLPTTAASAAESADTPEMQAS